MKTHVFELKFIPRYYFLFKIGKGNDLLLIFQKLNINT